MDKIRRVLKTIQATTLVQPLLIITVAVLSLLLLFYFAGGITDKSVSQQPAGKPSAGLPVRFKIPAININAKIQHVGVNFQGEMETPSNTAEVGWFEQGTRPGDKGSAVIAGHVDSENGGPAVFTNLNKLKKGDKLYVEDDHGKSTMFVVRMSRIYNPGHADEVFVPNDRAHLNLVTCDGVWDGDKKSYSKRLVVFTDIVH